MKMTPLQIEMNPKDLSKKKNIANPIAAISNNPSRTSIAASTRKKRVKN